MLASSDCREVVVVEGDNVDGSEELEFVFVTRLSRSFFNRSLNEPITMRLVCTELGVLVLPLVATIGLVFGSFLDSITSDHAEFLKGLAVVSIGVLVRGFRFSLGANTSLSVHGIRTHDQKYIPITNVYSASSLESRIP